MLCRRRHGCKRTRRNKQAQQIYKEDQLKAFEDQLADLETEIAIEEAVTGEREQLRLEQEIRKIRGNNELTDDQKTNL